APRDGLAWAVGAGRHSHDDADHRIGTVFTSAVVWGTAPLCAAPDLRDCHRVRRDDPAGSQPIRAIGDGTNADAAQSLRYGLRVRAAVWTDDSALHRTRDHQRVFTRRERCACAGRWIDLVSGVWRGIWLAPRDAAPAGTPTTAAIGGRAGTLSPTT